MTTNNSHVLSRSINLLQPVTPAVAIGLGSGVCAQDLFQILNPNMESPQFSVEILKSRIGNGSYTIDYAVSKEGQPIARVKIKRSI